MAIQHSAPIKTATWTGIITELMLAVFKGVVGYFSDSKALLGDALYSVTEAFTSLANKTPWKRAHATNKRRSGKIKSIVMILFSIVVLIGGVQMATQAIQDLSKSNLKAPGQFSVVAIFVSFAVREAIFQFQYRLAKKDNDDKQLQLGHVMNHRLGLITSLIVFIGVFLSIAGEMYGWPGLLYMDSIAGIIVAGLVIRKGYLLTMDTVYGRLAQEEIAEENTINFIDTIQRVHGIITVDDLRIQESGHYIILHVKVSVNPRITVYEAHDIAERVKKLLMNRFLHVSDVNIQVAPYDPGYPYKSNHDLNNQEMHTLLQ
ncbi:cation diffusion facilitator family transporter [Paenibacillus crassostreae]|uniref:Uncharacterized protein n=1 Tax=Paenibacillus crassostreae TaxID=1763538 RepID=A0A167CHE1_9BACL|nr:cation diffusion facilitator family transporter [Paenibacillus crassostreae]AOZ91879.1 hypothetical protein LPB68_06310 [Paenibacillus crassostreae]OAB73198.1 hypothetical protein PNBC_13980 [Paenibacillus crassostreae]